MKTIYVVFGTTGEYSDRTEWPVKAFTNKSKAEKLVESATEKAKEIFVKSQGHYHRNQLQNEYDPYMAMDYTGTDYYYIEVDLEEE